MHDKFVVWMTKLSSLDLQGPLSVRGVPQFRTIHREDFSEGKAEGWDNPGQLFCSIGKSYNHYCRTASQEIVSSCAGISMLGGYGKFAKVPKPKEKHRNLGYRVLPGRNQQKVRPPTAP